MRRIASCLALLCVFALADCGGGEGAGNSSCRGTLGRYKDCGLFVGGISGTCHSQPETEFDQCIATCANVASCAELEAYQCDRTPNVCIEHCLSDSFECENGERVQLLAQCDGFNDCGDNSDEFHCNPTIFRCGQFLDDIDGTLVCDGFNDCPSGLDEEDCGEFFCPDEDVDEVADPSAEEIEAAGP